MRYEWDEKKEAANITKHGVDFADAYQIFLTPVVTVLDDRFEYGEDRWISLGLLGGRVVKVVYTEPQYNTRRIISLRKAVQYERKQFEQFLENELGTS